MDRLIEWFFAAIFALLGLYIFSGCAGPGQTEYIYKDVYVPVRCQIIKPVRPVYQPDPVTATVEILEYTETLETLLNICTGE